VPLGRWAIRSRYKSGLGFLALALIGFEVGAEARDDFVFFAFVEFFLYFFQCEVDYVVMV
jgi:hypothetical protein